MFGTGNENEVIEDGDQYLNIDDEEDDEPIDEIDGNSDDSEERFDEPHEE